MKTILTDRALKATKPAAPGTRTMLWDAAVPSFGVRVTDKGKLTFIVMRRLNGKLVRRMLGQYPIMTLTAAREAALTAVRDIERGGVTRMRKKPLSGSRKSAGRPTPSNRLPKNLFLGMWLSFGRLLRLKRRSDVN
jgi:hypothetical protein